MDVTYDLSWAQAAADSSAVSYRLSTSVNGATPSFQTFDAKATAGVADQIAPFGASIVCTLTAVTALGVASPPATITFVADNTPPATPGAFAVVVRPPATA